MTNTITIEFTITEAKILCKALAGFTPIKENEMISFMIYARIARKIDEQDFEFRKDG